MKQLTNLEIIRTVADFQVLTISQFTELMFHSEQVARRRIRLLERDKLVLRHSGTVGNSRGRPESLLTPGPKALQELRQKCPDFCPLQDHSSPKLRLTPHQIAINWCRIKIRLLADSRTDLRTRFFSSTSPFHQSQQSQSVLRIATVSTPGAGPVLIPDGTFMIQRLADAKSLLFFLEVDLGTESLVSRRSKAGDLRTKILHYRMLLGRRLCGPLEKLFNTRFKGFRLLFVANDAVRAEQICRVVRQVAPADFVWVTDQASVLNTGIAGRIWARGGSTGRPESILGSMEMPNSPATLREDV